MKDLLLDIHDRYAFREWLEKNAQRKKECWLNVTHGEPVDDDHFWYIDAVEEALCFGWISSIQKEIGGVYVQRFCKRQHFTPWTELDKERVRRLQKLGLMTEAGLRKYPKKQMPIDPEIEQVVRHFRIYTKYRALPPLYRRVRTSELTYYKETYPAMYRVMLKSFLKEIKTGNIRDDWNDYGRLLDY